MSTPKSSASTYESNVDYKTPTPSVYRRGTYYRVLTRPDGKRKVMHRFDTYEEAVEFKRSVAPRPRAPRVLKVGMTRQRRTRATNVAYLEADPCAYCDEPGDSIDHIVPVAGGGGDDWTNLTASCRRCNTSKGSKPLLLFLAQSNGCFEWRRDKDKREQIEQEVGAGIVDDPLFTLLA